MERGDLVDRQNEDDDTHRAQCLESRPPETPLVPGDEAQERGRDEEHHRRQSGRETVRAVAQPSGNRLTKRQKGCPAGSSITRTSSWG